MLYKKLAAPLKNCRFNLLNGSNSADPIVNMFPQCKSGKVSPDLCFISQALKYLETRVQYNTQDKLFEKVFWQLIRIQSQLHRHTVQRPLTPGLQWFLRFYSHSSPIRKVFNTRDNVISSAITSGFGRGLKSLELRTSPFTSNSKLLTFIIDVKQAAEEIQKNNKNEQPLELGIVFHFIKQRGGNAEKGEPIAHGKNSNADPVVDSVFTETVTNGNPQGYRFASFYLKKKQEALSLIWLLKHHPNSLQIFRGLDVCTDELAVPNWVLASIVNEVRQQSIITSAVLSSTQGIEIKPLHMTAHAGEDFVHLLTGLRNIDEAIEQFKLAQGDRLGHAVALGIDPVQWAQSSGKIPVKCEDRLFDLIWLWSWFGQSFKEQNHTQQISMEHEIAMLTNQIFTNVVENIPGTYDLHLLMNDLSNADKLTVTGFPEGTQPMCHLKKELLYQYLTSPEIFKRGQQVIWIDPFAERELLLDVQNQLRRKVGTLGITIEVNPSSAASHGERTRGLVVPRRRRSVVLSESER